MGSDVMCFSTLSRPSADHPPYSPRRERQWAIPLSEYVFGAVGRVSDIATRGAQEMVRLWHSKRIGRDGIVASKLSDAFSNRNSGKSMGIVLTKIRVTGRSQAATMRAFRSNFDYHLRLGGPG
jgi:hypothetical protein